MLKRKSLRNKKLRPTHPGAILREDALPALKWSQTQFAKRLGVSRQVVADILAERQPVTLDIALRLARLFGMSAEGWLNMQHAVDAWDVEHTQKKILSARTKYSAIKPLRKSELQAAV